MAASLPSGHTIFSGAHLVINGAEVFPDVPLIVFSGRMLVPIRIVAETLGATVSWDPDRQAAGVELSGKQIELKVGSSEARVGATQVALDAPAVLYSGRTLVPLRFVSESLGCEVGWDAGTRTATVQSASSGGLLTAVDLELLPEHAVVHLRTDGTVPYQIASLAGPERLVVDLTGAKPDLGWTEKQVGQASIQQVRVGIGGSGASAYTRVVCDLNEAVRFDHRPAADGKGVDLIIYYKVSGVAWENGGLTVRSTGPVASKSFSLSGPDRYVIDLPGASLSSGATSVDVGSGDVVRVRVAQNQTSPDIVRIVLDLQKPLLFKIARFEQGLRVLPEGVEDPPSGGGSTTPSDPKPPVNPGTVTGQTISYAKTASGGRLALTLAAEPKADVVVSVDGRRVALQITGAVAGNLVGANVFDGMVDGFTVEPIEGGGFVVNVSMTGYGGHTLTVDGRNVTLDLRRSALLGRRIVVDAGHGGPDPGAISYSGIYEKYVNWPIALAFRASLERAGAVVKMTRSVVDPPSILDGYERTSIGNAWGGEVFISIHCNSFTSPGSSGTEVYHSGNSPQSLRLAKLMSASLSGLGLPNRGAREGNYVVCRESYMPAVLIELGFLSSPVDEAVLLNPASQARAAELMAEALDAYFR